VICRRSSAPQHPIPSLVTRTLKTVSIYIINDVGTRADATYEALKKSGVLRELGEL
jgi:hypothetical protein